MRNIETKARTSVGNAGFAKGQSLSVAKNGANAADANPGYPNQTGGDDLNKGRLDGGTPKHYNGGQASIRQGTTGVPPR